MIYNMSTWSRSVGGSCRGSSYRVPSLWKSCN